MIVVYRDQPSESADSLAECLGARRVRKQSTLQRLIERHGADLKIVSWGGSFDAAVREAKVLNTLSHISKFEQAARLTAAGVPTLELSRTAPARREQALPRPPFVCARDIRTTNLRAGVFTINEANARAIHAALGVYLETPPPVVTVDLEWIPRAFDHVGGTDIIDPAKVPVRPAFYSRKENFLQEYRVHSFAGKSIRAGIKVQRPEFNELPLRSNWVRSWDGGWKISYNGEAVRQAHRDLAHRAVAALGLTFGAVDIGADAEGQLKVIEVNQAPGIEGGTLENYASAITAHFDAR